MWNGRVMTIHLIVGLIKKTLYKMSQYFPKPYEPFRGDINVKVHLSKYARKAYLKNTTGCSKKWCCQKSVYNTLVSKVNNIDTSRFVLKSKYDTDDLSDAGKKFPDTSGLVKKQIIMLKLLK